MAMFELNAIAEHIRKCLAESTEDRPSVLMSREAWLMLLDALDAQRRGGIATSDSDFDAD